MNSSTAKYLIEKLEHTAKAVEVRFSEHDLIVDLEDGRTISVPLAYYPRLYHGHESERRNWVLEGEGIHWPELDEDIRTADLLIGLASGESQESLKRWLEGRQVKA
jgi:predicted transcriptional regulator